MRPPVELRLGVDPFGVHSSGDARHLQFLRGRSDRPTVHRRRREAIPIENRQVPAHLYDFTVFLFYGPAEGSRAADKSFRRRRRGLRAELADRSSHQGRSNYD